MAISKKKTAGGPLGMLINHAEKIILTVVGLGTLTILGMTSWSPYPKNPLELNAKIDDAKNKIVESKLPEEKKTEIEELKKIDTREKVQNSFYTITSAGFEFPNNFIKPLIADNKPIKEPSWYPVVRLIATPGKVVLAQLKEKPKDIEEASLPDDQKTKVDEPKKNEPNEFTPRPAINPGTSGLTGSESSESLPGMNGPGMLTPGMAPGMMGSEYSDTISNLSGEQIVSNLEVVPVSFISVRGIFQRHQQIRAIADSMNIKYEQAEQLMQFYDFKLERQESSDGADKWSNPWTEVDKQVALDFLEKSPDWEPDVISAAIFDPVITMSLPARLMGVWNNYIDHPDIKDFTLSPEEMKIEAQLNLKALETLKEERQLNAIPQFAPKGLSVLQRGTRQAQEQYITTTPADKLLKEFEQELKKYDNDAQKLIIEKIKNRVKAEGNLILFRYIDFDVRPGKTYRYRVKLEFANPSYGMSA